MRRCRRQWIVAPVASCATNKNVRLHNPTTPGGDVAQLLKEADFCRLFGRTFSGRSRLRTQGTRGTRRTAFPDCSFSACSAELFYKARKIFVLSRARKKARASANFRAGRRATLITRCADAPYRSRIYSAINSTLRTMHAVS